MEDICDLYDLPESGEWLNLDYLRNRGLGIDSDFCLDEPSIIEPISIDRVDVCVFHAPCPDGTAAAFAIGEKHPDCDFFGVNRGSGDTDSHIPYFDEGAHVVLVDYVYSEALMEELIETAGRVHVIDHHVSEHDLLQKLAKKFSGKFFFTFSTSVCAAVLAWKLFHPDEVIPVLYHYINDNDVGAWKLANVGRFAAGFSVASPVVGPGWSRNDDFTYFKSCVIEGEKFIVSRILMGMIAKHIEWRDVNHDAQRSADRRLKVAPQFICRVVNVSYTSSSGGLHRALLEGADVSLLYYYVDCNDSWKCSLRSSSPETNVGYIAAQLGGGGHACAASFSYKGDFNQLFLPDQNWPDDDWDDYWGYNDS
jgi:hypothetical protein